MNRNQIKAVIFVVVFLLVVAVIVIAITGKSSKKEETAATEEPTGITVVTTPEPTGIYIVDAPPESYSYDSGSSSDSGVPSGTYVVDDVPSGTYVVDEPDVVVVNTPSPGSIVVVDTPKPGGGSSPTGVTIASGSFVSNTGTALNVETSYTAVTASDSAVSVTVSSTLRHASLNTGSRSVTFKADGQTASASATAINYDGGNTSTYLGSHTFTVNLSAGQSKTIYISSSWAFNGQYSGISLGSIEGAGNVTLSR